MLNEKIVFVCNDVGAAEQISNYIKYNRLKNYSTILTSTSEKIFLKNHVKIFPVGISKIKKFSKIITGTSWRYKNEIEIIKQYQKNKKLITILDEVSNLKKRFKLNNHYYYPHEIWVPGNLNFPKKKFIQKTLKL